MQNKKVIEIARQTVGSYLQNLRNEKNISAYKITKETGLTFEQIKSIENGSSAYTIDSFLTYIGAIDCYFYLANRDEKHLDEKDMLDKMDSEPGNDN